MIDIDHLTKSFGAVKAVDDLSLRVPRGELFCFLGPNGAGKTTTIKILCGLLRPTAGHVRIGGLDLARDGAAVRRMTGYIPDLPFLYDRLTVAEMFRFTGDLYGLAAADVAAEMGPSLDLFGLADHASALVKDLSHGMRQRLVYATTFLHRPQVLFVDEPFVGLDPYSIRLITDLLRAKARGGMTIFLTTHILPLAQEMADRIGIVAEGRLAALGTMAELARDAAAGSTLEEIYLKLTVPRPKAGHA